MPIFQKPKAQISGQNNVGQDDSEKGSMTIFGLGMAAGIVAVGGITLDTMYYEGKRVATQDALDRCSVMAALAQNRFDATATGQETEEQKVAKAKAVAEDCMETSLGSSEGLELAITAQNSGRSAQLSGNYTFASLNSSSTETKSFELSSTATQTLPNLEITVALDISHPGNLALMKQPLIRFLNTVAAPDTGRKISINIVPFGKNVILDPEFMAHFNTELKPPFTQIDNRPCILLPEDNKDEIAIDMTETYRWSWPLELHQTNITVALNSNSYYYESLPSMYVETNSLGIGLGQIDRIEFPIYMWPSEKVFPLGGIPLQGNCHVTSTNNAPLMGGQIPRPGDPAIGASVADKINNLVAVTRTTGTNAAEKIEDANSAEGLKWALAAMDPSLRQVFDSQVTSNTSPDSISGRPLDYGLEKSQKILIFVPNNVFKMNDGTFEQTATNLFQSPARAREIKTEYLDGSLPDPDIWRVAIPGEDNLGFRYSIYHEDAPGPNKYWVTSNSYGNSDPFWAPEPFKYTEDEPAQRQSWRQVFERMTVDFLIKTLYMQPMKNIGVLPGDSEYHYENLADRFTYVETDGSKVIDYFEDLCDEAKEKGVIIYTLLGNGTANINGDTAWNSKASAARATYSACATPARSFGAGSTAQINSALRLISSNIAQMTLTQ